MMAIPPTKKKKYIDTRNVFFVYYQIILSFFKTRWELVGRILIPYPEGLKIKHTYEKSFRPLISITYFINLKIINK